MPNIYIIKNKINDKVYIGQTINKIETRFINHKMASRIEDTKFYRAIRKYGEDNFYIELLEEVDINSLNEREQYWINFYDSYNNGYNSTLGGDGVQKIDYEKIYSLWNKNYSVKKISETMEIGRDVVSKTLKNIYNITEEEIKLRGNSSKYILSNEEIIKYWNEGYTINQIVNQHGGDLLTTKKRLVDLGMTEEEISWRNNESQRNIKTDELKKIWEEGKSINEICKITGSNRQTIKKQLFYLGISESDIEKRRKLTCNKNKKSVVQLDKNNKMIAIYPSAAEAMRLTGISNVSIGACCNKKPKHLTAGGYKWKFLEDYEKEG